VVGPALITRTEAWPIAIQSIQSTHKKTLDTSKSTSTVNIHKSWDASS